MTFDYNAMVLAGHAGSGMDTGANSGPGNTFSERFKTHLGDMDLNQQGQGQIKFLGTKGLSTFMEAMGSLNNALALNQVSQIAPPPATPFQGTVPGGLINMRGG